MKNYVTLCLLSFICAFSISSLSAQDKKETKKVIIVEEKQDADGNVTKTRIVKEGKDAEEYIKSMESKGENIWVTDEDVEIEIEGTDHNMIEKKAYKMVIKDDEGNEDVMEWDGEGEMPADMKELMKEHNVHIDKHDGNESKVIIMKNDGNQEDILELKLENGELSEEVHEMLEEHGVDLKLFKDEDGNVEVIVETIEKDMNTNKAQLGVFIEDHKYGAKVTDFTDVSAAKDAGLVSGDIITQVNKQRVNNIEELVEALAPFQPGDVITLDYLRGDVFESKEITLKKREKHMHKTIEKTIETEDGSKKRTVKKKVIIKEEK